MRRNLDEQQIALECLRLAGGNIQSAERMLAFVTGTEDAAGKLKAVREAIA